MSTAEAVRGRQVERSLLFGNFVIGCGVMVVVGTLNDITRSLNVSVSIAGQLVSAAAVVMCFGAPLLAGWSGRLDRRKLLVAALAWYAIGHALCALMPSFAALLPVRAITVLGAAVFTPQAAAAVGALTPPEQRGRAITFIFLGWSIASVVGMPAASFISDLFGWRVAFMLIAVLSLGAAAWVHGAVPDGLRAAPLTLSSWREVFGNRVLMAIVLVTALAGAGQFTLFSYFAPYFRTVFGAGTVEITLLFVWFGFFGLVGNVLASRHVDRLGAARAVEFTLLLMAASLLAWPLVGNLPMLALALVPWGLACFSAQSMQQARLNAAAPALAPALMALNTSAIYLGQAAGASSGGWLIAHLGYAWLSAFGLAWLIAALGLSVWASRTGQRVPA
ncbi:MAG TPA: MFS transporter [Caldimonas sp.]|jgi:predicted MFS family arabinose efflux permease|nr:MFS transporter [Caldimonas sp.]HEX2540532.1 MFS transporter [Caldimonas sp.]